MPPGLPLIVRGYKHLKCLPDLEGPVSWLPTDVAADVVLDFRQLSELPPILHIIHPKLSAWTSIMKQLSDSLLVPLVPYSTWLSKLEVLSTSYTLERLPALRLLEFYKRISNSKPLDQAHEAMGMPLLNLKQSESASPTLRSVKALTGKDVQLWIKFWSL